MDYTELSNGVKVPLLGLGTFMVAPEVTAQAVYTALKNGYRLIDTANAYLNEKAVGEGLQRAYAEGICRREDVFLSTKLWPTVYNSPTAVEDTLKRLGTTYVDLLFIHQPAGDFLAGYRQLERAYQEGKARSLGISNFHGEKLTRLLEAAAVKPQVVQLETHPYRIRQDVLDVLAPLGTKLMGWYPLGHGDPELLQEPVITAIADRVHKSAAQVILRWAVQKGFITIPGSKNPDHIRDNFALFDFALTPEELEAMAALNGKKSYYEPDNATEEKYAQMHLPFER